MALMSGFSPCWDCEGVAQHNKQKQRLKSFLQNRRNQIGLGNDHQVEMRLGKNWAKIRRSRFQARRKQDEYG
jgi:hypothetical protein